MGQATFIDVETTGLDPTRDEVVELATVWFTVRRDSGETQSYNSAYRSLSEPTRPIPRSATEIHGITDTMVAGCRTQESCLRPIVEASEFIVAHNERLDRAFLVRLFP